MLSENGLNKNNLLHELSEQFWGSNVQILDTKVLEVPFDMFEIKVLLYGRVEVLLGYDRSIIAISIKTNDGFVNLRKLTTEKAIIGFKSSEKDSILHNFKVLDKTLREMSLTK